MPPSKLVARDFAADDPSTDRCADDHAAYHAATRWLYDRIDYERWARSGSRYRFTLDRMRDLITRLGHQRYLFPSDESTACPDRSSSERSSVDPPAKANIVHIAGTKGKGSVATMVAAMLSASGYRVGLYTSPHLVDLEERFRVDGQPASRQQMTELIDSMQRVVDEMSREGVDGPSFFELTTAIAIEHFHRCRCDYWVLETGLGGRLDSTNVFQTDVTLLTSIGLDHQHVLGDTIELIAKEKAGILKPAVPAISGVTRSPAREVIRQSAAEVGAPLLELGRDFDVQEIADEAVGDDGTGVAWGSSFQLVHDRMSRTNVAAALVRLGLEGRHQIGNAAVAWMGLEQLGISPGTAAREALAGLQIDARVERFVLSSGATVILDAAHNPDSITALVETMKMRFPDRRLIGVFGTSVDKDAAVMLDLLRHCFDAIVLTRYHGNPRYVAIETLADLAVKTSAEHSNLETWFTADDDPLAACQAAIDQAGPGGVVVVCGSFFLAAEVRPWLLAQRT